MKELMTLGVFVAFVAATPAYASETVSYTYDALGRLVQTSHSGTVNGGLVQSYQHDAADNRTNVTVTGSPFNSPNRVIVVPLNGLTVMVIRN